MRLIFSLFIISFRIAIALDNGLALTPPMGFANWNGFGCNYDDATIRGIADALVSTGMKDVGYNIIIIQECITPAGHRDANGVPQPDPKKFPYGMKNLVDYIHSKGLKAGIYTDVGPYTCAKYEGSYNHEKVDADTYASWGIDFVEEDACNKPSEYTYQQLYGRMRDALNSTGRPIIFYACVWGQEQVWTWGTPTANLWRTTGDICPPGQASWQGVVNNFYGNALHPAVSGPGHWQDPDMLVVGMPGLTVVEYQTHFSLWAISAAPLWAGIDIRTMSSEVKNIFLNTEVIMVDQDPLGFAGQKIPSTWQFHNVNPILYTKTVLPQPELAGEVWAKKLSTKDAVAYAVVLFNPDDTHTSNITVSFKDLGMDPSKSVVVRDLWKHVEVPTSNFSFSEVVAAHGSVMITVKQNK